MTERMTEAEVNHWNMVADETPRVDADLRDMAQRSLRIGANLAVLEVERHELTFGIATPEE